MKTLLTSLICAAILLLPAQAQQTSTDVVNSFSTGEWEIRFGGKTHYSGQVGETSFEGYWHYGGKGTMSVYSDGTVQGAGTVTSATGSVDAQTSEGPGAGNFQMQSVLQIMGSAREPLLQGMSNFSGLATVKRSESVNETGPTEMTILKIKTATPDRVTGHCTAKDPSRRGPAAAAQAGFQSTGEMEFEAVRVSSKPRKRKKAKSTAQNQNKYEHQPQAAVDWALSQEGVTEKHDPDLVRSYSKGRWEAWCAHFVSTAYEKTGGSPWGHRASVAKILEWARERPGHFISTAEAVADPGRLNVGDVVVWKQNGRSHVGLFNGLNADGTFNTIEGNTIDQVARRTHEFSDKQLTGFVRGRGSF